MRVGYEGTAVEDVGREISPEAGITSFPEPPVPQWWDPRAQELPVIVQVWWDPSSRG